MATTRKLFTPPKRHEDGTTIMCAPTVMMALTGKNVEQVYRSINNAGVNTKNIHRHGMFMHEISMALNHMGYQTLRVSINHLYEDKKPPTMAKWVRERTGNMRSKTYLLYTHNHVMLISGNEFIDTASDGIVHIDNAPRRRSRIIAVHEIKGR